MKKWYQSRTLWLNAVAAIAVFLQSQYGFVVSPELQAYVLVIANTFMRTITSEGLTG